MNALGVAWDPLADEFKSSRLAQPPCHSRQDPHAGPSESSSRWEDSIAYAFVQKVNGLQD